MDLAKANNIEPVDFPYPQAQRICMEAVKNSGAGALPMSEDAFRSSPDPTGIINNCATVGNPQPAEMARRLKMAQQTLSQQDAWIKDKQARMAFLNAFGALRCQRRDDARSAQDQSTTRCQRHFGKAEQSETMI